MSQSKITDSRKLGEDFFNNGSEVRERRSQSRFFGKLFVDHMPEWLMDEIRAERLSVCDWGCAEGDGTDVLSQVLGNVPLRGIDFDETAIRKAKEYYPHIEFVVDDLLSESSACSFDVLFSSNTLGHFPNPWEIFVKLSRHVRRFMVFLIPFREFERHNEHEFTFDARNIRFSPASEWVLVSSRRIKAGQLTPTFYRGDQILLVYGRTSVLLDMNFMLSQVSMGEGEWIEKLQSDALAKDALIRECREEALAKDALISQLVSQRDQYSAFYHYVMGSRSWKITRPLRSASGLGRYLIQKMNIVAWASRMREWAACHSPYNRLGFFPQCGLRAMKENIQRACHDRGKFGMVATLRKILVGARETGELPPQEELKDLPPEQELKELVPQGELKELQPQEQLNWYKYCFFRYKNERESRYGLKCSDFCVPQEKDLVTIVLPVFNGEDMVAESIESVLRQTYRSIELIIINDGSTDKTPEIIDKYAKLDQRISVFHQKNKKLPLTLSRGMNLARGEFITWTSADNIMHDNCIEILVQYLKKYEDVGMAFGNVALIDDCGQPMYYDSFPWYQRGQDDPTVYLPHSTLELNTYPNNTICAAFMYRKSIAMVAGDYSQFRYTLEDYDYWMKINELFFLRHIESDDAIYDYRMHEKSLTARDTELGITAGRYKLMIHDDFRRDLFLGSMVWVMDGEWHHDAFSVLTEAIHQQGHIALSTEAALSLEMPTLGAPSAFIAHGEISPQGQEFLKRSPHCTGFVIDPKPGCVQPFGSRGCFIHTNTENWENLNDGKANRSFMLKNTSGVFPLIDSVSKVEYAYQIEKYSEELIVSTKKVSVIICTIHSSNQLARAFDSVVNQTMNPDDYEIIIVNNKPFDSDLRETVLRWQEGPAAKRPVSVRYVDAPVPGLSHARNIGGHAACGEVLFFTDDDAECEPQCLQEIYHCYRNFDSVGVVGGQVLLQVPEHKRQFVVPGYESVWSHFPITGESPTEAIHAWEFPFGANFSVRREVFLKVGGFRCRYGRKGADYGGGEEIALAAIVKQYGYKIWLTPRAIVKHHVDGERFNLEHVQKTIFAGLMTNYRLSRDLYLPMDFKEASVQEDLQRLRQRLSSIPANSQEEIYCRYRIDGYTELLEAYRRDREIMVNM
ncbi:glycosyltransferase [Desulforhabdus sp. TSK]|uniref:glycosyltransferase n=1 Tax=Desulforhabdus sp. TSK TaxID=2925014 RepID=UPI001FC8DA86|nr:glycosyltransferase [Desulforhabdus sp. TSK]GKT10722.1 hypothetical protein DSTSK_40270 [Desulforhabdus sp. TSK]